jgi:hypothetical protein
VEISSHGTIVNRENRLMKRIYWLSAALIFISCTDNQQVPVNNPPDPRRIAVTGDPATAGIDIRVHVPGSLKSREDSLIGAILARTPEAERAEVEQLLRDPGTAITGVDGDVEAAHLLSHLYAIRAADRIAAARGQQRAAMEFTIVVAPDHLHGDEVSAVLRRKQGHHRNVVVISDPSDLDAIDRGVTSLLMSRGPGGDDVAEDIRLPVRRTNSPAGARAHRVPLGPMRFSNLDVEGIGNVPAVTVRLGAKEP